MIYSHALEIKEIKKELKGLPKGNLTKKRGFYYHYINYTQKGITKNIKLIRQLARKAYLLVRLKLLEENERHLSKCTDAGAEGIIQSLSSAYQSLPKDYFFIPEDDDWPKADYERNPAYPEDLRYRTKNGVMVRSKSERTIADALFDEHIPFRYEAAVRIGNEVKYPDFTIKMGNLIVIWEHMGRMDMEKYRQKIPGNMKFYGKAGFYPFCNLICTYEEDLEAPEHIHYLIRKYVFRVQ